PWYSPTSARRRRETHRNLNPGGTARPSAGTRGVAQHRGPHRHIAGQHTAGPDDGVIAHHHARQDDRAAADPDILADHHRLAVFQSRPALPRIAWMIRGIDLHGGADLA